VVCGGVVALPWSLCSLALFHSLCHSLTTTFMVARRGSPADVGLSLNGRIPAPRATMKVAPTESWFGA
jgi:hypothetical protein